MRYFADKILISVSAALIALTFPIGVGFAQQRPAAPLAITKDLSKFSPSQALQLGTRAYYAGRTDFALKALSYSAQKGNPAAAWKLGQMYEQGDGVVADRVKAFKFFSMAAQDHQKDETLDRSHYAPFVANSLVSLGSYYLEGLGEGEVKPDMSKARDMFFYAAAYYGDADAQCKLGLLYLANDPPDRRMAARWLKLAAQKGQLEAQAHLGAMLCDERMHEADGLTWLTIARRRAKRGEADWIYKLQERCAALANPDQRQTASHAAKKWIDPQSLARLNR